MATNQINAVESTRPREVYKEQNTKLLISQISREDQNREKVSARPAFGPEGKPSIPLAIDFVISPEVSPQEREVSCISPREHSSRYSGISVQHVRTEKGIKVAITLQQSDWAATGAVQLATAELKRSDRLREVKAREDDSEEFAAYLEDAKQQLRPVKAEVAMGRLHQRGRRSSWLYDTLIVAFFENNKMNKVMLYLEGEEVIIEMDREMSTNQQKYYLSQGILGSIQGSKKVPRLSDLPLSKFGEQS
jgi:hypothetical protein